MKIYVELYSDFDLDHLDMTSQARDNLNIIEEHDKTQEFIEYLDDVCMGEMSETELSDLLHHDWEDVFDYLEIEY